MSTNDTAERLKSYHDFRPEVIDTVSAVADQLKGYENYQQFLADIGIDSVSKYRIDGYAPVEIVDIRPREHNPREAMVVDVPMANPLDPNILFQVGVIAAANPDKRLIAAGNPSGGKYQSGSLSREQRKRVIMGDWTSVVEPVVKYIENERITRVEQIGYSYGADKSVKAAAMSGYAVSRLVAIEPSVQFHGSDLYGTAKLGAAFMKTNAALSKYVEANKLPIFEAARRDAIQPAPYTIGLLKPSNIAIARGLANATFESNLVHAVAEQQAMVTTLAWGTDSELAIDSLMLAIGERVRHQAGDRRYRQIRLPGQRHALANDLALQTALVLEGTAPAA